MENEENCSAEESTLLKNLKILADENNIQRLDEEFLHRFLVGRGNDTYSALQAMCNYQSFISRRRDRWLKLEISSVEKFLQARILEILDKSGTEKEKIVWIRLEKWDPQIFTTDEVLKFSGLFCELLYASSDEIRSVDVIMDMHNFSFKQLYSVSRKFAKRMVFFMSECLPMQISHIYVIRQPKIFFLAYSLYKSFLEEEIKKRIHVCGYNYEILMEDIGRKSLPEEFDGTCEIYDATKWINIFHDRKTQKGLKLSGYEFFIETSRSSRSGGSD